MLLSLSVNGPKVGVAQSGAQGQVRANLPVVLKENSPHVLTVVVAIAARKAGRRLKGPAFRLWSIIQEIPEVVESVVRRADRIVQIIQPGEIKSELHGLCAPELWWPRPYNHTSIGPESTVPERPGAEADTANLLWANGSIRGKQLSCGRPNGA